MDIFKFQPLGTSISLTQGQVINGLKSKMWIERYRQAGEFTLVAPVNSDLKEILPIGSLISHTDTKELMIVENHEINDDQGSSEMMITVTGRSFETFLEQRALTANKAWPSSVPVGPYNINPDYSWKQAVYMIRDHIDPALVLDANDGLSGLVTSTPITRTDGVSVLRSFKAGSVYSALMEILDVDNLGIRLTRPVGAGITNTSMEIHEGVDRRSNVVFSFDAGDLDNADYLWSIKSNKNTILVVGRWVQQMVKGSQTGYNRRVLTIDASDIDQGFSSMPTGADLTNVQNQLTTRGRMVLAGYRMTALSKAQASKNAKRYLYRTDFDVGDIVTIDGEFNESAAMRITEYVEIDDEKGMYGYPTLADV